MIVTPSVAHPDYLSECNNWELWRLASKGGDEFIRRYLVKFSSREDDTDFTERRAVTYCPSFAKAALNDVKNAIFQRITDVTRKGGPKSYQDAVVGRFSGVDRRGSTMNSFIGRMILPELLTMRKVGIYIDREPIPESATLAYKPKAPYLYRYVAEDICTWLEHPDNPWDFCSVLLRETVCDMDPITGMPKGTKDRFRKVWLGEDGKVRVQFLNSDAKTPEAAPTVLNLTRIPFVLCEISQSLMEDAARYQVALLNMSSSDVNYILKANFPFYTEQVDRLQQGAHLKQPTADDGTATGNKATSDEVTVGATHGRRYGKGLERPDFIAPPTEPLKASMEKQDAMKNEIRQLINLALSNVTSAKASAESKGMDQAGLEAGLSYIGLELEHAERQIASIWAEYEQQQEQPTVKYPERYTLRTRADIMAEAKELEERMMGTPSETYKREVAKQIVRVMLGQSTPDDVLEKIDSEIEGAKILTTNPETIFEAVELGLLDNKGAAASLGIPPESVDQAAKDHAERLARIAKSQADAAQARGVPDQGADPKAGEKEKKMAEAEGKPVGKQDA
jgi:hypothetical protein